MTPGDLGEYGSRGISGTAMRGARLHIESGTVIRILIIRIITGMLRTIPIIRIIMVTVRITVITRIIHIILRTGLTAMTGGVSGLLPPIRLRGALLHRRVRDEA